MAQRPNFRLRRISAGVALCTGAASMVLMPALPALANPSGGTVVHGAATFTQDGTQLQIDNSPGAIIDWASFSIAQDEITRFQQQSAASAVLNRVTGGEISELHGQLVSNGQVFLINPNGMVFGQNATIDTAGFVASTLDISNEDFLGGDYRFTGDSGRIVNEGYLTTRSGNVFFIAPDIENAGIIHAESGALVLAAGRSIRIGSLDNPDIQFEITAPEDEIINLGQLLADQGSVRAFAGTLTHSGAVSANGVALAEDGSVILHAQGDIDLQAGSTVSASGASGGDVLVQSEGGTVINSGEISAIGASGDGGRIRLLGDRVGLLGEARVSAEGATNGGEILIGGNLTGLGPEPNASAVFIGTDTRVSASSTDNGNGGTVIAYADELNRTYGTLTARGGPNGGDGGFIETSADFIEVTRTPDAGASVGAPGEWLIDPDLLVIGAGGLVEVTENSFSPGRFDVDLKATAPTIEDTVIENAINGGTSVRVFTAGNAQSIRIQEPLDFNVTAPGLFLVFNTGADPAGNIFVEAPITNTGTETLDYLFFTDGFVDFGADVDTGGLGEISVDNSLGYGGTAAMFSGDAALRGNFRARDTSIIGPFAVRFEGDFADLRSLTLRDGADLAVTGDLTLQPAFEIGRLEVAASTLEVGGAPALDVGDISAGSAVRFSGGGTHDAIFTINDSVLTFAGTEIHFWNQGLDFSGTGLVEVDNGFVVVGAEVVNLDNLLFSGGTITGFGDVFIGNSMTWTAGTFGDIESFGNLRIGLDATLEIDSPSFVGLQNWILANEGTINWLDGDIEFTDNVSFENLGVFNALLTGGPREIRSGSVETSAFFGNSGQFIVDAGAAEFSTDVFINNFGTVQIDNGLTRLLAGSASNDGGNWSLGSGGVLRLEGGPHFASLGTTFSGPGTVQVTPGAVLVADGDISVDNLLLDGGTVGGGGETRVLTSFTWNSGTIGLPEAVIGEPVPIGGGQGGEPTLGGGGIAAAGGAVLVAGGANALLTTTGLKTVGDAALALDTGSSTVWDGGEIRLTTGGGLGGVIALRGDLDIRTDTDITSPDASGLFVNEGSITKKSNRTGGTTRIQTRFDNLGAVTAEIGTLSLERDGTHEGTFTVLPAGDIFFQGTHTGAILENVPDQVFAGPAVTVERDFVADNIIIQDGGNLVFNGAYTAASTSILNGSVADFTGNTTIGDLTIDGGTFTGPGSSAVSGNLQLLNGGRIDGAGTVSVTGTFDWINGVLAGTGVVDIAPGGNLVANPGASLTVQDRTLLNRSEVGIDLVGTGLALNGAAVLDNRGRMSIAATPTSFILGFTGTGTILNSGSFVATGIEEGPSLFAVNNRFDNSGTLTLNSGFLRLHGGGTHTGSFLMVGPVENNNSGRLRLGGTHTLGAGSSLAGASVGLDFGTTTVDGAVDIESLVVSSASGFAPGHLILNSDADLKLFALADRELSDELAPMLSGTGNISVATQFIWDNGIIGGTGSLNIADTAGVTVFGSASALPAGTPAPLLTLSGRTLGTAAPEAGFEGGRLQIVDDGLFVNSGGLGIGTAGGPAMTIEGGTAGTFRNTGTVTGLSGLILGTTTESSGTLQAPNLGLAAGVTLTQSGGSLSTPGTFDVRGTLTQQAGTLSAGTILFPAGSSATLAGTLNADRASITGSDVSVSGSADLGNLLIDAGTFSAPGTTEVRSNLRLANGGVLDNSGALGIGTAGGTTATIEGGADGTFRNSGTTTGATGLVLGVTTENAGTLQAPNLRLATGVALTQTAGSISTAGTFDVAGDLLLLGGSITAATTSVTGSLGGIGTLTGDLNNAGTLAPGTSPGTFVIDGDFTQDALGTLVLEIDGDAMEPGVDFDLLDISGTASFDGTLELITLDGFTGEFGSSFEPITYASATGAFARVVQPASGVQFVPTFGPTGLSATFGVRRNPDGTVAIDTDNPPIPADQMQAEEFADAVARSRGRSQEDIETTDNSVILKDEQELVQEECAERLDRPDGETGDDGAQGVGCRSL